MRVRDLTVGYAFKTNIPGMPNILKVLELHPNSPCYPGSNLTCVIWATEEGKVWSHDHLSPYQDIGEPTP